MKCPNCQSTEIRKHGFYRSKQRYQCKTCARQFVESHTANLHNQTSTGVEERVHEYIRSVSTTPADLLLNLRRDTATYPLAQMQPTLEQAQFIALLGRSIGASQILEVGIFSGYSTLALALVIPKTGRVTSCGVAGSHLDIARTYWQTAGVETRIDLQIGSGLDVLNQLVIVDPLPAFDLIAIAGLKHQYPLYYHQAIKLLRPQGLLITTDVLWQGRVLDPTVYGDEFTSGIDKFNRELAADSRVQVSILPIGDGLSVAVKL
jgi:O-methyltransferase